jgi:hypothetical protein
MEIHSFGKRRPKTEAATPRPLVDRSNVDFDIHDFNSPLAENINVAWTQIVAVRIG